MNDHGIDPAALAAREERVERGGCYADASERRKRASDALKSFREEHDDPTGRLALADRVLAVAREVEGLPGDGPRIVKRGDLYWRVVSAHAVDHPDVRAAITHAGVTGSVGCTFNEAKVERVNVVPVLPGDGQRPDDCERRTRERFSEASDAFAEVFYRDLPQDAIRPLDEALMAFLAVVERHPLIDAETVVCSDCAKDATPACEVAGHGLDRLGDLIETAANEPVVRDTEREHER